ncbi:unnamed protein product, partial [Prunus brigantina]
RNDDAPHHLFIIQTYHNNNAAHNFFYYHFILSECRCAGGKRKSRSKCDNNRFLCLSDYIFLVVVPIPTIILFMVWCRFITHTIVFI